MRKAVAIAGRGIGSSGVIKMTVVLILRFWLVVADSTEHWVMSHVGNVQLNGSHGVE